MLPSSPTTTTSISLFSLFFLAHLPTLTSTLPTPLSPTTSDGEIVAPFLQVLPQSAVPLTQRIETETSRPMVTRSEESSSTDTDDTDDTGPDYEYSKVYSEYATYGQYAGDYDNYPGLTLKRELNE